MPARIDEDQVRRVAHLSRLKLSSDEVRLFTEQLRKILSYVDQLSEVDTQDVEPLVHPLALRSVTRADKPTEPLTSEAALQNAPQREGDFFRVPAVLQQRGES